MLLNQCHVGDQKLPLPHLRDVGGEVLCAGGQIAANPRLENQLCQALDKDEIGLIHAPGRRALRQAVMYYLGWRAEGLPVGCLSSRQVPG